MFYNVFHLAWLLQPEWDVNSLCERAREKNDLRQVNFNEQMYILSFGVKSGVCVIFGCY